MEIVLNQLKGIDLHEVCRLAAIQYNVPEALICYLLFEKLYARAPRRAIVFFIESELTSLLFKVKGKFELIPDNGHEMVIFEDGTTLGRDHASITWQQFFRLVYIEYIPQKINDINTLLTEYLHEHIITKQIGVNPD